MLKKDIKVGGHYIARVSGKLVTVRVDAIRVHDRHFGGGLSRLKEQTTYDVTNLSTGKRTTFRSAQKFRRAVDARTLSKPATAGQKKAVGKLIEAEPTAQLTPSFAKAAQAAEPFRGPVPPPEPEPSEEDEQGSDPTSPTSPATKASTATPSARPTTAAGAVSAGCSGSPFSAKPTMESISPLAALLEKSLGQVHHDNAPHLIVEARAGTGKTTTLIEGLKRMRGLPTSIEPSPQQAAVWEQMELSRGARTVCFVAFNKGIATELQQRVPRGCDAMTMHSMGFRAVRNAFPRLEVSDFRVTDLIAAELGRDIRELRRDPTMVTVIKATQELVSLCKINLIAGSDRDNEDRSGEPSSWWDEELNVLTNRYDVDLNGSRQKVFDLVPRILERCKDPLADGRIDYDDMIWLPIILNLPVFKYDLLLVDEAQDLNRCQQALAKKAGQRLILVGDPRQAIYGFAGADAESMPRMSRELGEGHCQSQQEPRGRGCFTLPLTVTRRCGKAIVEEARKIVPDFEAHESNPAGSILYHAYGKDGEPTRFEFDTGGRPMTYHAAVQDGDFILCRVNAPLVSQCFRFLKAGRKANIQGRDVGQGLISTIKKLKAGSVSDLIGKLDDWCHAESAKESAKRNPSEAKLIALQDRRDCLACFCENALIVEDVIRKIEQVFTDDKKSPGIRLSSIHKAKGLESRRVFLLQPKGGECPHPMAKSEWQRGQEMNLLYVAVTRAIEELVYVS